MAPVERGPDQYLIGTRLAGPLRDAKLEVFVVLGPSNSGAFLRGDEDALTWCPRQHVFWQDCSPKDDGPSLLRANDRVTVHSPAGRLTGLLTESPTDELSLRLAHGAILPIALDKAKQIFLIHDADELHADCGFAVRSKSGNRYAGRVTQVLPDGRVLVRLRSGNSAELQLEKLDLETLELHLEIPPGSPALFSAPEPQQVDEDGDPLEAALESERGSSRRLKRVLDDVLKERTDLKKQVAETRRALESEVWRGMARNKELTSELRELKERLEATDTNGGNE